VDIGSTGWRHCAGPVHSGPHRDATAEQTDVNSFEVLEPTFDGFRNHLAKGHNLPAEHLLVGGLHALDANTGHLRGSQCRDRLGHLDREPSRPRLRFEL